MHFLNSAARKLFRELVDEPIKRDTPLRDGKWSYEDQFFDASLSVQQVNGEDKRKLDYEAVDRTIRCLQGFAQIWAKDVFSASFAFNDETTDEKIGEGDFVVDEESF